jgi:hypothetical protein
MNKICRFISSVALFVICGFSPTNAGAATEIEKMLSNSIGMKFVQIPAGSFARSMKVKNDFGEESVKSWDVTISKPFYFLSDFHEHYSVYLRIGISYRMVQ